MYLDGAPGLRGLSPDGARMIERNRAVAAVAESSRRGSSPIRSRIPWILFAVEATLAVAGTYLEGRLSGDALYVLAFFAIAFIGALIASRLPENRIGWVFLALTGVGALGFLSAQYSIDALLERPGSLPAGRLAAWLSGWTWFPTNSLLVIFVPLLFPDGHLPSPRWRWVAWAAGLLTAVMVAMLWVMPGPVQEFHGRQIDNPLGIEGAGWIEPLFGLGFPVMGLLALLAASSMFVRFAKGDPMQRQQLKLFGFAALLVAIAVTIEVPLDDVLPLIVAEGIYLAGIFAIAIAAGLAIFKYRLYEIDLVINRTIVYLLLSLLLGLVYFVGVAVLQGVVGLGGDSDLAVAASTLAVAGLFQPARRRVQDFIDHYFYRRRYDAQRTIDAFTSRLRDEIDLSALNEELVLVVGQTMQPKHVSVWLLAEERT
jgi:hypothetical protein